jgi:endonuclease/exonuclease/phosphatase family metal-dependent hydrolase
MTWNIRNGARDAGGPDRLDRVVEVVRAQRPDVLALQELRDFHRHGRMDRLATAVGMRAYLAPTRWGQPVAVLVRPSLPVHAAGPVRRPWHHAAQKVVLGTGAGPVSVLSAHLCPYAGWRRRYEAGWLAGVARGNRLTLVAGDLNTLDPWTDHTARLDRLPATYRRRHLRRDGTVDTRAVGVLHRAGLVDLFTRVGQGGPDTAPTSGGGGAEFSGMRLDYLMATPALAGYARVCRVVRGGAAETASDHHPVLADLDLDRPR